LNAEFVHKLIGVFTGRRSRRYSIFQDAR
jgi:hypothetical protein